MNIRVIYDQLLRTKVAPVTVFDDALKKEANEMVRLMKANAGLGLAANQVGLNKQLIVLGYEPTDADDPIPRIPLMQLTNLRVTKFSQAKETMTEGCLSLPGLELPVERSAGVTIEAQDLTGRPVKIKAKGLSARVLQHEIDHLNGILFTDHVKNYQNPVDYRFAKIVFFGSDDFSAPIFQDLLEAGYSMMAAVTETDKPAGRGRGMKSPLMKKVATEAGVAVLQPASKAEIVSLLNQLKPDLIILASYGQILPAEALSIPAYGALNLHPSLLPKYRGATPIQSTILAGEKETGVSLMVMSPEVDAGLVVSQLKVPLMGDETYTELKDDLAATAGRLLLANLPKYLAGQAKLQPQAVSEVTQTRKLTKSMGEIDWTQPTELINRQIRALNPWPGTWTELNGQRLKILRAELKGDRLLLIEVQLEGKTPAAWADFRRGHAKELTNCSWTGKIYQ